MFARKMIQTVGAVAVALGLAFSCTGTASACDPPCRYQKVVTYVCKSVPYQVCVTKYDHCGKPYHVYVTKYRTIEVPVVRWVKICG